MRAFCLIPGAVRTKSQPVTASIKIPPGTVELVYWLIVTQAMLQKEEFAATLEGRFWGPDRRVLDQWGSVTADGDPALIPVGMVGGQPGEIPGSSVNFDLETVGRNSPAGGGSLPEGAEYAQITLIPLGGGNGNPIWCGCVVTAQSESGEFLDFDPTTRGS